MNESIVGARQAATSGGVTASPGTAVVVKEHRPAQWAGLLARQATSLTTGLDTLADAGALIAAAPVGLDGTALLAQSAAVGQRLDASRLTLGAAVADLLTLSRSLGLADTTYVLLDGHLRRAGLARCASPLARQPAPALPLPRSPVHVLTETAKAALPLAATLMPTLVTEALLRTLPTRTVAAVSAVAPLSNHLLDGGSGWASTPAPATTIAAPTDATELLALVQRTQAVPGRVGIVHLTDGRAVVLLPGIHSLLPTPDPQDLPGALDAFSTGHSAYARSVAAALTTSNVAPGTPLLLIGHSQGGIVAADLAADPAFARRWPVTHVLAAGSPLGTVTIPAATKLLAVDNASDIVPLLDLGRDRTRPDRLTVVARAEHGSVGGNHSLSRVYEPLTASGRFRGDPAVQAWTASAAAYLRPGPVAPPRATTLQWVTIRDRPPGG